MSSDSKPINVNSQTFDFIKFLVSNTDVRGNLKGFSKVILSHIEPKLKKKKKVTERERESVKHYIEQRQQYEKWITVAPANSLTPISGEILS